MIKDAIELLKAQTSLSRQQSQEIFATLFNDAATDALITEFLIALYKKGETKDEVLGAIDFLKEQGETANCETKELIDCCGTGGDKKNTFNISTAVSFVLAGAGCSVAKHGNKAVSSQSGSADVLTALGIDVMTPKEKMVQAIDEIGIGFLFAPLFYPLMKKMGPIRKTIPHRTIFNILGPLLNPAQAQAQLVGVFSKNLTQLYAEVLKELGCHSAVIVHAENGMDEFSLSCNNHVVWLRDGQIESFVFDPRESGYDYCDESELIGGTSAQNAARLRQTLKGHSQAVDHVVHINAAWGLMAAGKAVDFKDGLLLAQDSVSSGRAYHKLEALAQFTQS